MKFKEFKYSRPDIDKIEGDFEGLLDKMRESNSLKDELEAIRGINTIRKSFNSMETLSSIRNSLDIKNEFYREENEFFDENKPRFERLVWKYYLELTRSKYRRELEEVLGSQLFKLASLKVDTFSEHILEDLIEENRLITEYRSIMGRAKIYFEARENTLSDMTVFLQDKDREVRRKAEKKYWEFFTLNEGEFDLIFDRLVKVRDRMAKKLGYGNYIDLAYKKLGRFDYNHERVKTYREQILEYLVPISLELRRRQKNRLRVDSLKTYDEEVDFIGGNASPKGSKDWILQEGKNMYSKLSEETDEFFSFMLEKDLMDVLSRDGKRMGGYCTIIPDYKAPFIYANFNGSLEDIDVLTHEAGHGFQMYMSKDFDIIEYLIPTLDLCEVHSMGMEFLTWPYMDNFFKEDVKKYKYTHLSRSLNFMAYGALVDEFQHSLYENLEIGIEGRKDLWNKLEEKYMPYRDKSHDENLLKGIFWFKQGHIFTHPFYYIDYTLAGFCALQILLDSEENREKAWEKYVDICRQGGSKSFLEIIEMTDLKNPFEFGSLSKIVDESMKILDGIGDF